MELAGDRPNLLAEVAGPRRCDTLPRSAVAARNGSQNVFSRPQTQRDVARTFLQVKGSLLDSVRR